MKLTQEQIDWLNKVVRGTWEYEHGEVNVIGNVILPESTTSIPVQFGYVTGYFDCGYSNLTSLKGCPREVGENFYCGYSNITSLKGCPQEVGGYFHCSNSEITSLQYAPRFVGGDFYCSRTKIKAQPDASHIHIGGELYWE